MRHYKKPSSPDKERLLSVKMSWINLLLKFASIAFFLSRTKGEMFTALVDMEHLIYREREMLAELRNYVFAENAKIQRLKAFLERLEETHSFVDDNVGAFLGHPVNSYSLIHRYYKDWPRLEFEIQKDSSEGKIVVAIITFPALRLVYVEVLQ